MKKILFAIVALVALILSSCSNDEIEIVESQPKGVFTCNVNVTSLYDEFDMTNDITEMIRDKKYAIRVYALLYNPKGECVKSLYSTTTRLSTLGIAFKDIEEGNYTLVTIQTCIPKNSAGEYVMNAFDIENFSKLSTLALKQKLRNVYFYHAVGVATQQIYISEDNRSVAVTPKAIGSLLHILYCGYNKSSYLNLGFATRDIISDYKLDPSISRNERFITDLTASGYTNIRSEKTNTTEDIVANTVYVLEKSIQWYIAWQEDESAVTDKKWTHYQAKTQNLSDGQTYFIGAGYIDDDTPPSTCWGTSAEVKSWYKEYLKKYPSSDTEDTNIIPELYTTWGGSVAGTQLFMKGYTMICGSAGKAEATGNDDGSYWIAYQGKGKESLIGYFYTAPTTGLSIAAVLYQNTNVSVKDLTKYLNSKYTFLNQEYGEYYYTTKDKKTIIILEEDDENIIVQFCDASQFDNNNLEQGSKHAPSRATIQKGNGRLEKMAQLLTQAIK